MKSCWFAIVVLLLSTAAFAQAVGPESVGDSFTAATTAASLAADRSGPVLAWVRPQANGQSRVYIGRTDGNRIVAQELTPFGATPSFTFDWPAIASDGNDTVVVARQNSTATIGWAISRSLLPQLVMWSAAPPALAAANGRFYVVAAVDPATGGQTNTPDEIARAQSATVYTRTVNPASPLPCIIGFCGPSFASYQGRTFPATFTADSIGVSAQTDPPNAWQQTTGAGVWFVSGQSATIAASPKDWIVLSRTADDAVPGPLVAWRYTGDGTAAPSVAAPITVTIIAAEPSAVRPPDGTRFWYARAAFDGQRYGVAWQERSPRGDHDIWFATIDADNRVSAPILVAGSMADERRPLIAATGSGSFFVAYDSGNGTSVRVAGRSVTLLASRRRAAVR